MGRRGGRQESHRFPSESWFGCEGGRRDAERSVLLSSHLKHFQPVLKSQDSQEIERFVFVKRLAVMLIHLMLALNILSELEGVSDVKLR